MRDPWPRAARVLEEGRVPRGGVVEAAAAKLGARALARPLALADDVAVVTVGGATIGGSGRTRVAVAVARALTSRGVQVAFVAHGYRARLRAPRLVATTDDPEDVGDEAVLAARALEGTSVVSGPDRSASARFAARLGARVLVLDGPLQLRPRRADLALLALDARAPFGSGRVLPFGDLRAPVDALLGAADEAVYVDATPRFASGPPAAPFGLFTALARPARIVAGLEALGLRPATALHVRDHGPSPDDREALSTELRRLERVHRLASWVVTPKCALHLDRLGPARPRVDLRDDLELPAPVQKRLDALVRGLAYTHAHGVP